MPPEKQKIIKSTLFSESVIYIWSLFFGYLISVIFYISLNTWFDTKLKNSIIHSNNNKINSSLKSIITDKIIQSQSDRIEQFIQGKDKVDIKPSIAQIESITNLILYGNEKYKIWLDTSSIILPFLSSPTQTNDQIVEKIIENNEKFNPGSQYNKKRLSEAKGDERKELIVNIIDFKQQVKNSLTSSLEPLTDTLKASWFYKSRRYLNGFIQFVTIWLAFTGLFLMGVQFLSAHRETFHFNHSLNTSLGKLKFSELNTNNKRNIATNILINTSRIYEEQGSEKAENFLQGEIQELRTNIDSRYGMVRYVIFAVPSIGFIGTVVGIGDALDNAYRVIGGNGVLATKNAVQEITSSLGIAFDTTLIALLFSLILMLCLHALTRYEERSSELVLNEVRKKVFTASVPDTKTGIYVYQRIFDLVTELLPEEMSQPEVNNFIHYLRKKLISNE